MANIQEQLDEIYSAQHDLEQKERRLLESRGWLYTSSNPASIWLYTKTIDGITYAVNADTAISFEEHG